MLSIPPVVKEKRQKLIDFFEKIGFSIQENQNFDLLYTAFIHKSYASDFKEVYDHNERLEFVGDAVLGAAIAKALFQNFPQMQESLMTLYKIALVREETLAKVAKKIQLNQIIFISKGEEKNGGREKASIVSDALEALIGYLFVDFGYEVAERFVLRYVYPEIEMISQAPVKSYKTMVQEKIQKNYKKLPTYIDSEEEIDEKNNVVSFRSEIRVDDQILAVGFGSNKKKAQEDAAKNYYEASQKSKK